jgi:ABC-type glutathione transport system ATPase component
MVRIAILGNSGSGKSTLARWRLIKRQQDERLSFLLSWVGEYYTRDGAMSLEVVKWLS